MGSLQWRGNFSNGPGNDFRLWSIIGHAGIEKCISFSCRGGCRISARILRHVSPSPVESGGGEKWPGGGQPSASGA